MGSGLILLVIVAAWLAVLVPMALRTHESSTSLSSVDRFSDAMRVLSRRDALARARARAEADDDPLSAEAYADNDDWDDEDWDDDELEGLGWRERLGGWRDRAASVLPGVSPRPPSGARRTSSPAARRRRLLLALVLLTAACLAGGAFGPRVLLGVAAALAVVVVLFVVQLRRLAVQRAERKRAGRATRPAAPRQAPARHREPVAVPAARSGSVRVQPASVHEPERAAAADEPFDVVAVEAAAQAHAAPATEPAYYVPAPAVRHDEPLPAARRTRVVSPPAALGEPWSPVPLPPPTYVTAPVAPTRAPRIVDLTRPGAWSQAEVARAAEELPGSAPKPEPSGDRRRAVNDW